MEAVMALVLAMGGQGTAADWVPRMVAYAARYEASLPSLECDEAMVSEEWKGGKPRQRIEVEGTFRVVRTGSGTQRFTESHQYKRVNGGEPPKHLSFPLLLQGAFANGLGFRAERVKCFDYRMDGEAVLVSTRRADAESMTECKEVPPGLIKRMTFDPATGKVTRVEATMPEDSAKKYKAPSFATIDYLPVTMGGEVYQLPARVETHDSKNERRFEVTYTNFRRFGGGMRVLSTTEVATPQ